MIPVEAVEAAARSYREQQAELGYPKWEDLSDDGREWRLVYMRAALEAAAPHMLAAAWDEGEKAGYSNCIAVENVLEQATNPYKATK